MRYALTIIMLSLLSVQVSWADHSQAREFVKAAVASKLSDASLSQSTITLLLSKDADGHPLSFIPDCPICLGVQDALSQLTPNSQDVGVPQEWTAAKPSTRTSSLARFVRLAVQDELAKLEKPGQRIAMASKLRAASEEGQSQLARYQSRKVEAYKMMWSCLMCDAAAKAGSR